MLNSMLYVINATRGVQVMVEASHEYAARVAAYRIFPDWRGDWIVIQDKQPTQELLDQLTAELPETD